MAIKDIKITESKANRIISTFNRVDKTVKKFDSYIYDEHRNVVGVKINENLVMNHITKIYDAPWTGAADPIAQELIIGKINNEEVLLINYRYITKTWDDKMYNIKIGTYVPYEYIIDEPDSWDVCDVDLYINSELIYKK